MYPDYEFYLTVFRGREDEEVIMPFLRAGADIAAGCVARGVGEGEREAFLRAACAQGEYMLENEGGGSFRLGELSVTAEKGDISPRAAAILEKAGLLYRGLEESV